MEGMKVRDIDVNDLPDSTGKISSEEKEKDDSKEEKHDHKKDHDSKKESHKKEDHKDKDDKKKDHNDEEHKGGHEHKEDKGDHDPQEKDKKDDSKDHGDGKKDAASEPKVTGPWWKRFLWDKYNLAFILVFIFAAFTRLKYFSIESIWNDAAVHLWYSVKVTQEPLWMFSKKYLLGDYFIPQSITAFLYLFIRDVFVAAKVTAFLYSMAGVTFMYLLGREIRDGWTGLLAALLFAGNHLLWFYGVRPLADGPLTVTVVLILYSIIRLEKTKKPIWGILTAGFMLMGMLTKKQAVIFFLGYFVYVCIFRLRDMIKDRALLLSWGIPFGIMVVGSLIFQTNFFYGSLYRVFLLYGGDDGSYMNVYNHLKWLLGWWLLIPAALGTIAAFVLKKKRYYPIAILFAFYALYLELGIQNVEDRIVMPILPMAIMLVVFLFLEIAKVFDIFAARKHVGAILALCLVLFIVSNSYDLGTSLIDSKKDSYAGHSEAGKWIRENVPDDVPVFAGSPRMQRAFTGREYAGPDHWALGGTLWYLRADSYLADRSLFEADLARVAAESEVYLEIDVWEYTQPQWYFPINQNSIAYFSSLGFEMVHVIERELNTGEGRQKVPVIFIMRKDQTVPAPAQEELVSRNI